MSGRLRRWQARKLGIGSEGWISVKDLFNVRICPITANTKLTEKEDQLEIYHPDQKMEKNSNSGQILQ